MAVVLKREWVSWMHISVTARQVGSVRILEVQGEVTYKHTAEVLRSVVADTIERGHRHLVIDLSEVSLLDSSAVGVLVAALRRVGQRDGRLAVVQDGRGRLARLLRVAGVSLVFALYDTQDEAIESFPEPRGDSDHDRGWSL